MQANKKFIIILSTLIIILIIGLGVIFYIHNLKTQPIDTSKDTIINTNQPVLSSSNTNQSSIINVNTGNNNNIEESNNTDEAIAMHNDQDYIKKIAKNFTERYGTYSNQNNYSNLLNIKVYMSKTLQDKTDKDIANSPDQDNISYLSVDTQAAGVTITEYNEDKFQAKVVVETIRHEVKKNPNSDRTYQQNLKLNFIKENDSWKVNSAHWRNK